MQNCNFYLVACQRKLHVCHEVKTVVNALVEFSQQLALSFVRLFRDNQFNCIKWRFVFCARTNVVCKCLNPILGTCVVGK